MGQAHLPEEAWWRYGRELTSRRARFRRLSITMGALTGAVALGGFTVGIGVLGVLGLGRKESLRYTPFSDRFEEIAEDSKLFRRIR